MTTRIHLCIAVLAVAVAGCSPMNKSADAPDYDALTQKMMAASFRDQGIARTDRLTQDASNAACSKAMGGELPKAQAEAIEKAELASVKQPADGHYIGDWKEGEKLAQNGRGMTWTDPSAAPSSNGGNCYNCHQLTKKEISFGTLGPSLYQYGKLRGVADPNSAAAKPIVEYTWNKLYDAKAYNACSGMPRFGHAGLLDEKQMKDLMALILDPKSPVNE
jgi:L-cysteine S-thiosulfotransferase